MQVSICEIHNDLIYESIIYLLKKAIDESSGKILVSDTALRSLMPNNARKMTDRYKQMCGFKICVIICSIQESLNNYPLKHLNLFREQVSYKGGRIALSGVDATEKDNSYANDVYPNNQHVHLKPKYSRLEIQCKPVDAF